MPQPFESGPISEAEFLEIEESEQAEAAAGGYQVRVERVNRGGRLYARVTYPTG